VKLGVLWGKSKKLSHLPFLLIRIPVKDPGEGKGERVACDKKR